MRGRNVKGFRGACAEWSVEWEAGVWNPPLPWMPGKGNESRSQLMPPLLLPISRVKFSQQLILKGGKIPSQQRRFYITQHKLSNLLGRLFREILGLKASVHDPKIRDGNQSWYAMWKASLHSLSVWNDPMSIGSGCQRSGGCSCRRRRRSSQRAGQSQSRFQHLRRWTALCTPHRRPPAFSKHSRFALLEMHLNYVLFNNK